MLRLKTWLFRTAALYPITLFQAGEVGAWYDPSDLSTLFQDTAGATPVTAAGQSVALVRDKSGRGNHATQGTAASRPIYSVVPQTGRRNLLTYSQDFASAAWNKFNTTLDATLVTAPDGTTTATKLVESATNAAHDLRRASNVAAAASTTYTQSVYIKAAGRTIGTAQIFGNSGGSTVNFDLTAVTAVAVGAYGGWSAASATITSVGNGWFRLTHTATTNAGLTGLNLVVSLKDAAGQNVYLGDGVSGFYIWGEQFEVGSTATAYQRVTSQYDVTEAGVPSLSYLFFDGTDDWLSTSAIDFSATDKMTVFAGVRKLSDAAAGLVVELSVAVVSNAGSFAVFAPSGASADYMFRTRGSAAQVDVNYVNAAIAAPVTNVLTCTADIAGDDGRLRVNGLQVASSVVDQGTGNYGNYPLYIGQRGGTTLPFNGHIYGLLIRGAASSASQITSTERWLARKTGVTI